MTKYKALLVIQGKTDMLEKMTDMLLLGIPFKDATKIALEELMKETEKNQRTIISLCKKIILNLTVLNGH